MSLDLNAFDLEDFSFWDVNDDSLFTDHDVYLAALGDYGEGDFANNHTNDPNNHQQYLTNPDGSTSLVQTNPNQQQLVPRPNVGHGHHPNRPKVLLSKNDKRRHYAKLFSEAFNSGDCKQLLNFLESYCTPNCEVIQTCVVKENPYIPKHVEVKGIDAIHRYWTNTFLTIPDCLIVMLETKLRIKNPHHRNAAALTNSGSSSTSMAQKSEENIPVVQSGAISRSEGSSIVSSFSFTGTKLYNMDMQNAVIKNAIEDSKGSNKKDNNALKAMIPAGNKHIQALINKSQKQSKKRSLGADWPSNHSAEDPSGDTTNSNTGQVVTTGKEGGGSSAVAHHDISDRYNIFLHPPRRFSTLAGTPFGGSSNHYYHPPKSQMKNAGKPIDYVEITANTMIQPGPYMESEGHINFLGTLTMFLDGENKISRFEFLYSHMD